MQPPTKPPVPFERLQRTTARKYPVGFTPTGPAILTPMLNPFELERYFARWEFTAPFLLSASDTEPWTMSELLSLASPQMSNTWENLSLGYTESTGHPVLRQAIADVYTQSSSVDASATPQPITADNVLVFSCAEEAIYVSMRALLKPGDHVVCLWPSYQSLYDVARSIGAEVTMVEVLEDDGWALSASQIKNAIRNTTRLVIINTPHNPTGSMPDHATWSSIVGTVDDAGAILFADEVYRLLEHGDGGPLATAASLSGRAISLGSVSKAFGLAGVRIGWIATRDATIFRTLETYKDYTTICASAPAEILAIIALSSWSHIVSTQKAIVTANLGHWERFMTDHKSLIRWVRPTGGSVGFPKWLGEGSVDEFAENAVQEAGVMVLPSSVFRHGNPRAAMTNNFRVGLGRKSFPGALDRLDTHIHARYGKI